jgi:hypothetical protein
MRCLLKLCRVVEILFTSASWLAEGQDYSKHKDNSSFLIPVNTVCRRRGIYQSLRKYSTTYLYLTLRAFAIIVHLTFQLEYKQAML